MVLLNIQICNRIPPSLLRQNYTTTPNGTKKPTILTSNPIAGPLRTLSPLIFAEVDEVAIIGVYVVEGSNPIHCHFYFFISTCRPYRSHTRTASLAASGVRISVSNFLAISPS